MGRPPAPVPGPAACTSCAAAGASGENVEERRHERHRPEDQRREFQIAGHSGSLSTSETAQAPAILSATT